MKIYVGNLPYQTTSDDLKDLFSQFGDVKESDVLVDKVTGRSRGFGFVTMANDEEAKKAIAELDGKDFNGRSLRVNEAQPNKWENKNG